MRRNASSARSNAGQGSPPRSPRRGEVAQQRGVESDAHRQPLRERTRGKHGGEAGGGRGADHDGRDEAERDRGRRDDGERRGKRGHGRGGGERVRDDPQYVGVAAMADARHARTPGASAASAATWRSPSTMRVRARRIVASALATSGARPVASSHAATAHALLE